MHGRVKKDVVELPPEELEKQRQQVRTARALFGQLLEQRKLCVYNQQTFDMTSKALQFHPEFPTLWGYRREILISGCLDCLDEKLLLQGEMKLLEKALRKTQKVYSIWFHRKWAVERLFQACGTDDVESQKVLDTELDLCGRLLEADERNFHCWNHRAHVMCLMRRVMVNSAEPSQKEAFPVPLGARQSGAWEQVSAATTAGHDISWTPGPSPAATEACASGDRGKVGASRGGDDVGSDEHADAIGGGLSKTPTSELGVVPTPATASRKAPDLVSIDLNLSKDLVNRNFSNYSAWHLRALLQQSWPPGAERSENHSGPGQTNPIDIADELSWVQQGIYTEPNDQSVWLYHHWLTALGRGCAQLRITHCALLDGDLYVFISYPVRAFGGAVTALGSTRGSVKGTFVPPGPDFAAAAKRTRPLLATRGRWFHEWKFVPEGDALETFAATEGCVEAHIEEVSSHPDGTPARRRRLLTFSGQFVVCDGASSTSPLPAMSSIIGARHAQDRMALLQGELARVEELLEIEPECRWAWLARGRLATALAAGGTVEEFESAHQGLIEGYRRMAALDPVRRGFYSEAQAEIELRLRILGWWRQNGHCGYDTPLDLTGLVLRHLPSAVVCHAFGVRRLNASRVGLTCYGPLLQICTLEELVLAGNMLAGDIREAFCLRRLRRLDVSNNVLELGDDCGVAPAPPPSLCDVDASGNDAILEFLRIDGCQALLLARFTSTSSKSTSCANWTLETDVTAGRCIFRHVSSDSSNI